MASPPSVRAAPKRGPPTAAPDRRLAPAPGNSPLTADARAYQRPPTAYDPGFAQLGGPAPVVVIAKPSWSRPGTLTAAAVIAFIVGGLSLIGAITFFTVHDVTQRYAPSYQTKAVLFGVMDLIVALALVLGGIGTLGRAQWGRIGLLAGAGLDAVFSIYRMISGDVLGTNLGGPNFGQLVWVMLDVVIVALVMLPASARYFATRDPVQQY